jgi:DNA modification methylase
VAIAELRPFERNPREHPAEQIAALAGFIRSVGFAVPVLVDREGNVVDGHARIVAAEQLGMDRVPVVEVEFLTPKQRLAVMVAGSRIASMGRWVPENLTWAIEQIRPEVPDLGAIGFSDEELGRLRADSERLMDPPAEPDGAGEAEPEPEEEPAFDPPARPVTREGDVWVLGQHSIACGDSLRSEVRGLLLGRERGDCVFTDPPYAIYGSSTGIASDITDDKMVRPFFREVLLACLGSCRPFAHVYVCCDWRSYPSWWEVAKGTGVVPKNCLVWDKGGSGLGANYANTHEWILFAWILPLRRGMSQKITGGRVVNDSNVWRVNRVPAAGAKGGREHNAQKPLDLALRALDNSTEPGGLVLDFFLGSGTTVIAAERSGRRCLGFEIDPRYCDVTVERWQHETGERATLRDGGAAFAEVAAERSKTMPKDKPKPPRKR